MNLESKLCVCKSELNPLNYYYDSRDQYCYSCPFNCICNEKGCIDCRQDSLRSIIILTNGLHICPCLSIATL